MKLKFTLIELLVVISIIGVLCAIVLTSLNGARVKANTAVVNTQMDSFFKAFEIAGQEQNKYLFQITGSACSRSACYGVGDLRNSTGACYNNWVNALNEIEAATNGLISKMDTMHRDPWGSPYLLDENEGFGSPGEECNTRDLIASAGPDGIFPTADDITFILPVGAKCQ